MAALSKPYKIILPPIKSGNAYYFVSDAGIEYEVRFGRKQDNILNCSIVFGVLNEEFDGEEYTLTNKFEVYRVMATIVEIMKIYMKEHPNVREYEYTGETSPHENELQKNVRIKLYNRYINNVFDDNWIVVPSKNHVSIKRKN